MNAKIHNQVSFCQEIELLVQQRGTSYFETICDYMNENKIEPESIPRLLNCTIKEKIEIEVTELNLINRGKKAAKLF